MKKTSYRSVFAYDRSKHDELKRGVWQELFQEDLHGISILDWTIGDMLDLILETYELVEDEVERELIFQYDSYKNNGDVEKKKTDSQDPERLLSTYMKRTIDGSVVPVCLEDLMLVEEMRCGMTVQEDCSCNSDFMTETLPQVGAKIRCSYHWVPRDQPIYLQLDNAGGHGTKTAIEAYKSSLQTEHNIIIINQPPRSPDSNVLDLGLWMAIQSNVDYIHQSMTISTDSVAKATKMAWSQLSKEIIVNVFGKLPEIWTHMAAGGRQLVS